MVAKKAARVLGPYMERSGKWRVITVENEGVRKTRVFSDQEDASNHADVVAADHGMERVRPLRGPVPIKVADGSYSYLGDELEHAKRLQRVLVEYQDTCKNGRQIGSHHNLAHWHCRHPAKGSARAVAALQHYLRTGLTLNDAEDAVQQHLRITRTTVVKASAWLESQAGLSRDPLLFEGHVSLRHRALLHGELAVPTIVRRVTDEAMEDNGDIMRAIQDKTAELRRRFGNLDLGDDHAIRSLLLKGVLLDQEKRKRSVGTRRGLENAIAKGTKLGRNRRKDVPVATILERRRCGVSFRTIASELGLPVSTIKRHITYHKEHQ